MGRNDIIQAIVLILEKVEYWKLKRIFSLIQLFDNSRPD